VSFVVFNTLFGAAVPNIDQAAHMGGLVTGFLGGLMLIRPWPVVHSRKLLLRRLALALTFGAALLGTGAWVIRWRQHSLPALARFQDFYEQVAPVVGEFNAIFNTMPSVARLHETDGGSPAEQELSRSLQSLRDRALKNRNRLARLATADPRLHDSKEMLLEGQKAQLAMINASLDFLKSHDPTVLTGSNGLQDSRSAAIRASREFEQQQLEYLKSNHLDVE
jgi:rhomboid protease GluP